MNGAVRARERQILTRCRLAEELIRRQLHGTGGWSHGGTQFATEPTAWALLALWSFPWASPATELGLTALMAHQGSDGLWPAVGYGARANFWATAVAVNALLILGAKPQTFAASVGALVHCCPLEASWLVRLKFRFSDRQVRFDPTKYGWSWVPDTVSWVVPTSMALITLQRARRRGLIGGWEFENRLRLGTEMLLDRACIGGGWNAGNAVVYGVRLRPHIDATAIRTGRTPIALSAYDSAQLLDLDPGLHSMPVRLQPGVAHPSRRQVPGSEVGCYASADCST